MLKVDRRGFENDMAAYRGAIERKLKQIETEPEKHRLGSYTLLLDEIEDGEKVYDDIKLLQIATDASAPEKTVMVNTTRDTMTENYKGLLKLKADIEEKIKYLRGRAAPEERTQLSK